jgi:proteasome lid subunit RPN8/RPN11
LNHSLEYYIVIDAFLEARHIEHSPVRLTFTSDTLVDVQERLEESYPDKQIVGWYHSHPALSIFLSSYDIFLHKNFFPQPWHVALVVDPVAKQGGFFRYSTSKPPYINPLAYYGFYELGNKDSVVDWNNLEASAIEPMDNLSQEG